MKIGEAMPKFNLADQHGRRVSLDGLLSKGPVVILFYPYDQSPTCTTRLCEINEQLKGFYDLGASVVGINHAPSESHERFAESKELVMPLLSDAGYAVAEASGCLFKIGPIKVIRRSNLIVGQDGRVKYFERGDKTARELMTALRAIIAK